VICGIALSEQNRQLVARNRKRSKVVASQFEAQPIAALETATGKSTRGVVMSKMSRRGIAVLAVGLAFAVSGWSAAQAQQKPVIKVSSLTLPVFNPLVWNVMKARGFDAKHGFELDIHAYPSIAAFYAGFATGETDALIGGPTIFQKLYQEGVQLRIIGTGFTLADLVIFAKDPAIKSLADLKGKQLAIDMGGSQYQVIKIYTAAKGIDLGKDITVVNANFGVARAQLEAGRVDAALVIEPLASISAKQHPDWHVIFNGAQGWKEISGESGWEIVPAMRADAIAKNPQAPKMLLAALQDVADVFEKETAAADKIANETLKLPPGIFTAAVESKRLQMIVKPAWEPATKKSITDMMERAVKAGFYPKMPDEKIIYVP
jgi:NitT/TauT family transport system substrate-binding protein